MGTKPQKEKVLDKINIIINDNITSISSIFFRSLQPKRQSLEQSWPSCFPTLEMKVPVMMMLISMQMMLGIIILMIMMLIMQKMMIVMHDKLGS